MKRTAVVFLVLVAALGVASCGGSDDDKGSSTQASAPSTTSAPPDLTGCLIDAGFEQPDTFVATVEIDGVEKIATVAFPPPHTEDNFLVVYEAPDEGSAAKAAEEFAGGPSIEQVGTRLYTVVGANDPLADSQMKAVQRCLQ